MLLGSARLSKGPDQMWRPIDSLCPVLSLCLTRGGLLSSNTSFAIVNHTKREKVDP